MKAKRVIGTGYNGAPSGESHCPHTPEHLALDHCPNAVHAERNALANALVPAFGATLYVVGPRPICPSCREALALCGVTDVRWRESVLSLDRVVADVRAWQAETFPKGTHLFERQWPEARIDAGVQPLDLCQIGTLNFERPDLDRFPCLRLAYEALARGGNAPAMLNAANEVAVDAFLAGRLVFTRIPDLIERVLEAGAWRDVHSLEDVLAADAAAREAGRQYLAGRVQPA